MQRWHLTVILASLASFGICLALNAKLATDSSGTEIQAEPIQKAAFAPDLSMKDAFDFADGVSERTRMLGERIKRLEQKFGEPETNVGDMSEDDIIEPTPLITIAPDPGLKYIFDFVDRAFERTEMLEKRVRCLEQKFGEPETDLWNIDGVYALQSNVLPTFSDPTQMFEKRVKRLELQVFPGACD